LPPFIGGAIGYAAYDVVRYVEKLDSPPPDDRYLPDLDFSFFHELVIFDNVTKTLIIVVLVEPEQFCSIDDAYLDADSKINHIVELLGRNDKPLSSAEVDLNQTQPLAVRSNFTQQEFEEAVRKCTEYIRAGDIFQVVVSQRMEVASRCEPLEVYRSLRVINPSPFMFFLRTPDTTLVGASPEVMCRVFDGCVTVRPLAGTRRRGQSEAEDRALAEELLADPKERAEHVMLVDLGRNDVGRVAQFGSVRLSDVMTVERYSHVMHISSNVDGKLRPELDAIDALKACLPAGTVSGAPKVRAMQILDEMEPTRRGPYAGAVGYFDYGGNMDTCIALRTMVMTPGKIYIQAGAGIVADSDPTSEYQETLNKSKAMLRAVELTEARLQ
jgi:anthranilate synthase component 1